jgi:hypothetical protein
MKTSEDFNEFRKGRAMSLFTTTSNWHAGKALTAAAALLLIMLGAGAARAVDGNAGARSVSVPGDPPQRLKVIQSSPLVAAGMKLGTVVLYDDPSTRRTADYLEVYDGDGGLVAVSWFDRFGIQRIAVDRSFVDGAAKLEGVFVAVVDDSFI